MALTVDQVYLLNCLSYMCPDGKSAIREGESVGDYCQRILDSARLTEQLSNSFQTKEELTEICRRIVKDPDVSKMTIAATQRTESGAYQFVAVTQGSSEAVVCYQGTVGDKDWIDNFQGGDALETEEQRLALDWYNQVQPVLDRCGTVTVTGHSKGGNKAKYVTLMNDQNSVDRCISFDGQGFSDEFMEARQDRIAARQDRIVNYSNENDYVNLLLNDVGERHYVRSNLEWNPLVYHSLFSLTKAYPFEDNLTEQSEMMADLDQFLNSYLRTLSPAQKKDALNMMGTLVAMLMNSEDGKYDYNIPLSELLNWKNGGAVLDLFVFMASYCLIEPRFSAFMDQLGDLFPFLRPVIKVAENRVKGGLGLDFPEGDDIRYASSGFSGGADKIHVETDTLESMAKQLRNMGHELALCARELRATASDCMDSIARHNIRISLGVVLIRGISIMVNGATASSINRMAKSADQISTYCGDLASSLQKVAAAFEDVEKQMVDMMN